MNNLTHSTILQLQKKFPDIVTLNVNMATFSHWHIGGPVAALVTPRTVEELALIRHWIELYELPSLVIGNTTNLLFNDNGVRAVVIQIASNFSKIYIQGENIIAQSGVYIPYLARKSMQYSLTGLEHTIGIPGTLGGLVYMNGGSQRKSISNSITYIDTMNTEGNIIRYMPKDCNFTYRSSIFQSKNHIITEVGLKLQFTQNKDEIRRNMLQILRERSKKFPRTVPNCGSVFISNPAIYKEFGTPGKIIEDFGLKGLEYGGAQISPIHANFIVNKNQATAKDVLWLIAHIRDIVYKNTNHKMLVEAKYVNADGKIHTI